MAEAEIAWRTDPLTAAAADRAAPRHAALVRVTHWLTAACVLALLISGLEIVVSHPRFYWGESGNVLTPALFSLPIPASRPTVPTGYGFVLPDQNGWSRNLHFQSAWLLVLTGALYVIWGFATGHFRNNLMPRGRFTWPAIANAWSYNPMQRLAYLLVIFALCPLMIWTGLAMSPAFVSAAPATVTLLGGRQSARTLHFAATLALMAFVFVHLVMIWLAGFGARVIAMITGAAADRKGDQ
jgi:thiosulfate reductase cytochrome b subunit